MSKQRLHKLSGPAADAANLLLGLATNVPLVGIERSCKFSPGHLHRERLLLGQATDKLKQTPLYDAHVALRMPASAQATYEPDRQAANFMYLGFDGSDDQLTYRIYLEFPVNVAHHVDPATGQVSKALLARGYKWSALEGSACGHHDVTDYWWEPRLTVDQILRRLDALWSQQTDAPTAEGGMEREACRALTRHAIELARHRSNALDWMYLQATEPASTRQSFDLNLYQAELPLGELRDGLLALGAALRIPARDIDAFLATESTCCLGHLSGGLGRDGQTFLTVYYTDVDT